MFDDKTDMTKALGHYLDLIPDHRRKEGLMYPKVPLLIMIVLANMSGCYGYREIARFMKHNLEDFKQLYKLKHGVPKHVSLRTFIQKLNFDELQNAFRLWSNQFVQYEHGDLFSIDGKGLNSTVKNCHDSDQNYKAMVSLFCEKTGIVADTELIETKKSHEGGAARAIIERLQGKGIIITMDALHCQKKLYPTL